MADETSVTPTATPAAPAPQPDEGLLHELATSAGLDPEAIVATAKAIRQHPWQVAKEVGSAQAGEFVDAGHHLRDTALSALNGVASAITNPEAKATAIARLKSPGLINKIQGAEEYATAAVPLVGGNYVKAEEQAGRGNIAGSIGTTLGTTLPLVTDTEGAEGIKAHLAETGKTFVDSAKEGLQRAALATAPEGSAEAGFAKIPGSKKVRGATPKPKLPEPAPQNAAAGFIRPDGTFQELTEGSHPEDAEKMGTTVPQLKRQGWVRKAGQGSYEANTLNPQTKAAIEKDIISDYSDLKSGNEYGQPVSHIVIDVANTSHEIPVDDFIDKHNGSLDRAMGLQSNKLAAVPGAKFVGKAPEPVVQASPDFPQVHEDYLERQDQAAASTIGEYNQNVDKEGYRQRWDVVPAGRLTKIWNDYAKLGFVRDEKGINQIADTVLGNIHKINVNNALTGHTAEAVEDFAERAVGTRHDLEHFDKNESFFNDENGTPRISDYAVKPLDEGALDLMLAKTPEAKLQAIDRILNIVHQRSDLSSWFVDGGKDTLNKIAGKKSGLGTLDAPKAIQGPKPNAPSPAEPVSAPAENAPAAEYHPDLQKVIDLPGVKVHTDPKQVTEAAHFVTPDGKFVRLPAGMDHPDAILAAGAKHESEGLTQQPFTVPPFLNDTGAIRIRPTQDANGTTLHVNVPTAGVTPEQTDALQQAVGQGLKGQGHLMLETADNPRDIKTEYKDFARSSDVEPMLRTIGAHPDQTGTLPKEVTPIQLKKVDKSEASEAGYVYHATSEDRAHDIAQDGLKTHKPNAFTDQTTWPDGATEKRNYFTKTAEHTWQFAPEDGKPVLIRTKPSANFKTESTGDVYTKKVIKPEAIEILGEDNNWHPITSLKRPAK